jgi:deoxyribodipyrimidine photolyase-related protein
VLEDMRGWEALTGLPVEIRDDDRFICPPEWFREWAREQEAGEDGADRPEQLRLEFFYREMRRNTGLLMEGDAPAGGRWNFDTENRRRLPARFPVPEPRRFPPTPSPAR